MPGKTKQDKATQLSKKKKALKCTHALAKLTTKIGDKNLR